MSKLGFGKVHLEHVYNTWQAKAVRYALSPITELLPSDPRSNQEIEIMRHYALLIHTWRKRLAALRSCGWLAVETPKDFLYTGNCPPYGVRITKRDFRRCTHAAACPWCWCRQYVRDPFNKFDHALYLPGKSQPLPFDLIEVYTTYTHPERNGWVLQDLLDWVQERKAEFLRERIPTSVGAYVLCSIEPPKARRGHGSWVLKHRLVSLVHSTDMTMPADTPPKEDGIKTERMVNRVASPMRQDLMCVMGRAGMYPPGLMTGTTRRTVEVLNGQAAVCVATPGKKKKQRAGGYRKSAYYGVLRGQKDLKPPTEEISFTSMESEATDGTTSRSDEEDAADVEGADRSDRPFGEDGKRP